MDSKQMMKHECNTYTSMTTALEKIASWQLPLLGRIIIHPTKV
jgi:hypothetical protein